MKHEVHLPQGTIRYRDEGSGEPLLFIHGVVVNGDLWGKVVPPLSKDFRCIVPDLPLGAHEVPAAPDADLSVPGQVKLIIAFMDALGLEQATLIGNDTGGALCQILAANHPERVSRMILTSCDMYERFPPPIFKPVFAAGLMPGALWLIAQSLRPKFAQRSPLALGWVTKRHPDKATVDSWLLPLRNSGAIRRDLRKVIRGGGVEHLLEAAEKLKDFDKPILLAWAKEDKLFPLEYPRRFAREVPNATMIEIDDSYTFIAQDQPEALVDAIASFVRRPAATVSA